MEKLLFTISLFIIVLTSILLLYRHQMINKLVNNSLRLTVISCLHEIKLKGVLAYQDDIKKSVLFILLRILLLLLYIISHNLLLNALKAYSYIFLAPILLIGFKDILDLVSDLLTLSKLKDN